MRINDATIEVFKEIWMRHDLNGMGLIKLERFRCFIIDLVLEELRISSKIESDNEDEDD
jgi:hypothetical protein